AWYGRGDISATFASTYKIVTPQPVPYTVDYLFEGKAHTYLPDAIGQLLDGRLLIAEAGLEQDKRRERNRAKAEAARKVAEQQGGVYWIGTEATLSKTRHANLVFLHARRQTFASWSQLSEALQIVWPWGEAACVQEVAERLGERWPQAEREAAVWKRCAESAARGHLLVDLASVHLSRLTPLICLDSSTPPILPDPLPSSLSEGVTVLEEVVLEESENDKPVNLLSTFDDSTLEAEVRERFLRNLRAVEAVLSGTTTVDAAREYQIARSTLSRLVQRARTHGVLACVPHGTYHRERDLHPAFQEVIRRLYQLPTKLSLTAIVEHADLVRAAKRVQQDTGRAPALPSYKQVRSYVRVLKQEPQILRAREQVKGPLRDRQSPHSFVLSIPAPAQLAQVDEHSMELYVITPDGIHVTRRIHAAVLICVKTAAILGAVLALDSLKEEDYMRLVRMALEPKDRLVLQTGCQHSWFCTGKPAIIFHDRGKIFTSERARQVLVDRLGIITEQAPPYCPSAKGTVEALFRWMTQRFERRLPNTSHGIHDAEAAAKAGTMTLEELERYFYRAIVDDYQQSWDGLRRQTRAVLWEEAVREFGVPQYLGAPDDLKLLLMKAVNRKTLSHYYQVHDRSRLSFQGRWYTCPGLLSRLSGREFELYYDRRDVSVVYLFVEGSYVGEAYCPQFLGQRVSEWEATAMRQHDREKAKAAASATQQVRSDIQEEIEATKKQRRQATREREKARQLDRQREEIHPSSVLSQLESLRPPPPTSLRLPKATPDPDGEYPVQILPIRPFKTENDL
ncbi:MAG: helix-turn-helix domain-containing protein, partial [Chloroflexi bacterium]|nr:helix-turn-helix domain-containing protein [Chloroflexota bacterium]